MAEIPTQSEPKSKGVLLESLTAPGQPKKRLGELLMTDGLISRQQLDTALEEQKSNQAYLGVILMRRKWISERELYKRLSQQQEVEFYEVRDMEIPPEVFNQVPREIAVKFHVMPVKFVDGELHIASSEPGNTDTLEAIKRVVPHKVKFGFSTRGDLQYAINRIYNNLVRASPLIRDFYDGFAYLVEQPKLDASKVIDLLLALGHLLGASDVHLTFGQQDLRLGVRIDGALHEIPLPTRRLAPEQVSQLRTTLMIRSNIDTSKRSIPQEGMIELKIEKTTVRARTSTFPLFNGDKAVLRFIGRLELRSFFNLGLSEKDRLLASEVLERQSGLIVVAAPDGNGKSTTLYALLAQMPTQIRNVLTIEDPVEAKLSFAAQTQVSRDGPVTFETALRHIGHQDADVIMIGTTTDRVVAESTVELASTGHLVLTAAPSEHAATVILHFMQMGIDPLAMANALQLVIAQRLAPMICSECRAKHPEPEDMRYRLDLHEDFEMFQGRGCEACYFTGRRGRIMLFEIINVDDKLRELIACKPTLTEIKTHVKATGGSDFRSDALKKCARGWISPEDVLAFS